MSFPRRLVPLLALTSIILVTLLFHSLTARESWRSFPLEKIGLGEETIEEHSTSTTISSDSRNESQGNSGPLEEENTGKILTSDFHPGTVKPPGSNYTKMLVIPRMRDEEVEWIGENLRDLLSSNLLQTTVYVADDPTSKNHPPKNKGHEVMIYLSYIIDHYDELADVNIFMHSHRWTWHNNDLLGNDAVQMIERLSAERVQREGYMNLRCHWNPGCPDWMHPGTLEEDVNKQEETMLAKSWSELFPLDQIPNVLAQPCCAQFAISRDRIRSLPLSRYVFYRDWLLRTPLSDFISGRVWEYIWQYIFTGQNVYCPLEHVCYCDGYGLCFGAEEGYNQWFEMLWMKRGAEDELREWQRMDYAVKMAQEEGRFDEAKQLEIPEWGRDTELESQIKQLDIELEARKQAAIERGNLPQNRALEAGRQWQEGDGF